MNLKTIREKIKNVSDYSPEVLAYDNQLDSIITDAYYAVWTEKRWDFAQKLAFLNVYPDITGTRESKTCTLKDGQRIVTFSAAVKQLQGTNIPIWEGNIFEVRGREYTIEKIVSPTVIYLTEPVRVVTADISSGVTSVAMSDWIIKSRFYHLPQDCIEIFSLGHRDAPVDNSVNGKTPGLSKRREEELNLKEDKTSSFADFYITVPPSIVPDAEDMSIAITSVGGSATDDGSFKNSYYELCWAVEIGGRVGPLSEPKTINVPNDNFYYMTVSFLDWAGKPYAADVPELSIMGYPRPLEGHRKVLYYNQNFNPTTGARRGIPLWRAVNEWNRATPINNDDTPINAADTAATVVIKHPQSLAAGSAQYIECDGVHQRVRPYPRIDDADFTYPEVNAVVGNALPLKLEEKFRQMELRYYYKPPALATATDTPQMPHEFHQVIVFKALEDIFIKSGNTALAKHYASRVVKELKRFEKRYIAYTDTNYRRSQFGTGPSRAWYNPDTLSTEG
jgi:hypothetical protein